MDASCMQLSIEGERLLKAQDYHGAIDFFEQGLRVGTDDPEVLSAVYNQLGNAYFYVGKFHKALEYHKKDLETAEKIGDRQGQAKAFGNLGNTFKSLKNFPNAIRCCEAHLEITRELNDKLGEGRACYNLGNVHHAVGKMALTTNDASKQDEGRASVRKAIEYYKKTLAITTELKDTSGEGRAVGNLGNAYTAIGEYAEAIKYHERRLEIAVAAEDIAVKYYLQSLAVAKEAKNLAGQGQAYYCLGSTYTMLKNYQKAVEYHERHLAVATEVKDKTGQLRAYYNLYKGYQVLRDTQRAQYYREMVDKNQPRSAVQKPKPTGQTGAQVAGASQAAGKKKEKSSRKAGEVEEFSSDEEPETLVISTRKSEAAASAKAGRKRGGKANAWLDSESAADKSSNKGKSKADRWLDDGSGDEIPTISASSSSAPAQAPAAGPSTLPGMDFFEMILESTTRMDDQRSAAPPPGTAGVARSTSAPPRTAPTEEPMMAAPDDESFFDMLASMQQPRLGGQRSAAPMDDGSAAPSANASVLEEELDPENMSLFEMLAVANKSAA